MATATLRPNATTAVGLGTVVFTGGATTIHGALGDLSTTTEAQRNGVGSSSQSVVEFDAATGVVPAGAFIRGVYLSAYSSCTAPTPGNFQTRFGSTIRGELGMQLGIGSNPAWGSGPERADVPGGTGWTLSQIDSLQLLINWPAQTNSIQGSRIGGAYLSVVYFRAPSTPTGVTPVTGGINLDGNPTLGANLVANGDGAKQGIEWIIASNSSFTANVKTVTLDAAKWTAGASGAVTPVTQKPSPNLQLTAGTWYVKARAKDEYGQYSAYSATNSFSVSHPATSKNLVPEANSVKLYTTNTVFSWTFSDPLFTDSQSAYQVVISFADDGTILYDSGKVSSTLSSISVPLGAGNKDDQLKWKVRLWDQSDSTAGYSQDTPFRVSDAPTVNITVPANSSTVDNGQPTITWTVDSATTQASRRIIIKRASDNAILLDSLVTTSSLTYTPPTTILTNSTTYTVQVTVTDTDGLSNSDTNTFTTSYVAPDDVTYTVDTSSWEDTGYVDIEWTTVPDGFFVDWRVYRREVGEVDWNLIAVYTNSAITSHHDWEAGNGKYYQYTVTQTAGRSGIVLESGQDPAADTYFTNGTHYWLINPLDESENMRLENVTADNFVNGYERESMIVIGRGRKVNQGTRLGYSGTMTAQFRDNAYGTARDKRMALERIQASLTVYFLRNPFGDVFEVSLGELSFDRISGVGISEFVDVTIPYEEVM